MAYFRQNQDRGVALVTGAAKRIGAGLAETLAKDGFDIALHYNHSHEEAEQTAARIKRATKKECKIFHADLMHHQKVMGLIPEVMGAMGPVTLLVNNASIFEQASIRQTVESDFDKHMTINFKAPFFLTQQLVRHAKRGQIINLLDTYITRASGANYASYMLSKKALHEFTRMAARAFAPDIRVNAIAIGLSEFNDNINPDYVEQRTESLPIPEEVTLEDIARSMLHLIHHPGLTGQCIFVDNGAQLL